ncbi:Uncharacterized protein BM_BM238 [Brugia malayi]|uniref:Uncharacterized protein n=1 Tax=Brugia malayi TaxID=6279 RepID=A0A4E9EQ89_BRUMA|nr:Uncharacterized protein BM_BM238 [Brugia malayi]VIO86090.1 Uncharacterized protein BM_BM238 [Brugia malayi]
MGEWKRTTEQKFSQPDANMVWKWVDRLYMFKEGGVEQVDGWTGRRNRRVVISGIKWTLVSQVDDWKSRTKISVLAASPDVIMLWSIRKRIGLINCKITAAI